MKSPSFEDFYKKHPPKHPEKLLSLEDWQAKYPKTGEVHESILKGMRQVESAGNDKAISGAGAIGPMQLRPAELGIKPKEVFNTANNLDVGARQVDKLMRQFGGDLPRALRAYNQGAGNERNRAIADMPKEATQYPSKVIQASLPFEGGRPDAPQALAQSHPPKVDAPVPMEQHWYTPMVNKAMELASSLGVRL